MERVIEGQPGDEVPIWIQDRGGGQMRLRGHIVIEDLRPVLTTISSKQGANGPQNPVTQYMLSEASSYLADRLLDDAFPGDDGRYSVPRLLSSALGHQPFIETVLGMSQHQMLRRWPLASDWYTDVVNYIMRPARFSDPASPLGPRLMEKARGPLGALIRFFIDESYKEAAASKTIRVAEALQTLWPDYPPVRNAMGAYREELLVLHVPLYHALLDAYDLRPHQDVDVNAISWAFNGLHARNVVEQLAGQHPIHVDQRGHEWTLAAYNCLLLVAGSCTDAAGTSLTPEQLATRAPVRPMQLP
ncbi:hypothetical protein G7070_07125 [Propioniciclava coleopterorum]|uniref:Uncharacterized protein n=1 Tax=Propioniciclava coleopterorum TaxID=2714937 RepID=A0A6G7Y632_9ACTN|nr:hypothetical protein [Propioniciclava coleopterorum]QIK72081.1 hypothetical protein G7070_07125 [Propioniciclava coleopterorum]